jgi:hypothetical protein
MSERRDARRIQEGIEGTRPPIVPDKRGIELSPPAVVPSKKTDNNAGSSKGGEKPPKSNDKPSK